jgi:hypothetical protein
MARGIGLLLPLLLSLLPLAVQARPPLSVRIGKKRFFIIEEGRGQCED